MELEKARMIEEDKERLLDFFAELMEQYNGDDLREILSSLLLSTMVLSQFSFNRAKGYFEKLLSDYGESIE